MQFLAEHSPFRNKSGGLKKTSGSDTLFLWIIVIATLIGLNAIAWIFCMYVFGHPEIPFNYRLLTQLKKIEPIAGFTPVTAPRGKFKTAKQFYAEIYDSSPEKVKRQNAVLKRNYLANYKGYSDVTYIGGNFRIENIKILDPDDVFPSGIAIRARADDYPTALIDYILPSPELRKSPFKIGDQLTISQSDTCAALLHIEKLPEEEICFTIIPLVSRTYQIAENHALAVNPPEYLNLNGAWPISPASSSPPTRRISSPSPPNGKTKIVIVPKTPKTTSSKD